MLVAGVIVALIYAALFAGFGQPPSSLPGDSRTVPSLIERPITPGT